MLSPTLEILPAGPKDKTGWPWTVQTVRMADFSPNCSKWPKISIITPNLNQGNFIEETIRSVLLQGYPNLEYIVIDGGSADDSVEIIKKYEKWITYWISEKDRGQSHAINKGFEMATGEWLSWLNADDILSKNALQSVAVNLSYRDIDIIAGASEWINSDGGFLMHHDAHSVTPYQMMRIWDSRAKMVPATQPSIFFSKDLLTQFGLLREDLHFVMDWELWLRFYANGAKWRCIDDVLSFYKRHEAQKTSEANLHKKWREAEIVFKQYSIDKKLVTTWEKICLRFGYGRKGWMHRNYRRSHREMFFDTIKNPLPLFDPLLYRVALRGIEKQLHRRKAKQ